MTHFYDTGLPVNVGDVVAIPRSEDPDEEWAVVDASAAEWIEITNERVASEGSEFHSATVHALSFVRRPSSSMRDRVGKDLTAGDIVRTIQDGRSWIVVGMSPGGAITLMSMGRDGSTEMRHKVPGLIKHVSTSITTATEEKPAEDEDEDEELCATCDEPMREHDPTEAFRCGLTYADVRHQFDARSSNSP